MTLAGVVFDAGSGLVFIAVGLLVALLRPWRALKTLFGLYAVGLGVLVVLINLPHILEPTAAGRHPLVRPGMDDFTVRQAILTAAPDLGGVPERLCPVLARALEKDPAARFRDAAAMLDAAQAARP